MRFGLMALALLAICSSAYSYDTKGFDARFGLVKSEDGKVIAIKLKKAVTKFTIRPFLEQIKSELMNEQQSFAAKSFSEKEQQIDDMLFSMGLNPYDKNASGDEEAQRIKESLLNLPNIDVDASFREITNNDFWEEFERKLKEAMMYIDPSILTYHSDARFFYKKNVTYAVVTWALQEAQKRFSNVPLLNIASFVIVRVHDMMMEQRIFHHNMLLHYFETVKENELGMTKEEVDMAVSSIYEYKIQATNLPESNRAARDWMNYGMNNFYMMVRAGNGTVRDWSDPIFGGRFTNIKKINFAFAEVNEKEARKIYHLHVNAHQFSSKPAMAFDYSQPNRVKRNRALLNLAGVGLGFLPIPGWIKGNVQTFIKSLYVEQVRMEGALVGYFEMNNNGPMMNSIYGQRANFYIVE
ncbi:MAG: hypothetical protein V4598_01555 [Bdellovibrionota bacterium]